MALEKNQTGIASEFYVVAELSRLGYDVTITFGNTKLIDLLHIDNPDAMPEFFVLTQPEALKLFKNTPKEGEKRTYLDYNRLKTEEKIYKDRWHIFNDSEYVSL